MSKTKRYELSAVRETANDLEQKGYSVVIEPSPSKIPFDLYQYQPDILATRGDENLVIDIKGKGFQRSIDRYKQIADAINRHPNWRFMISTVDETDPTVLSSTAEQVNAQSLNKMLRKLENLLAGENYDLSVPYIWLVYISAMRVAGEKAGIPIDARSDQSVLDYMYSLGEITSEEYETAKQFLELRNKAVHHVSLDISKEAVSEMYQHTKAKLADWGLA